MVILKLRVDYLRFLLRNLIAGENEDLLTYLPGTGGLTGSSSILSLMSTGLQMHHQIARSKFRWQNVITNSHPLPVPLFYRSP